MPPPDTAEEKRRNRTEYYAAYRAANKEKLAERQAAYNSANRKKKAEYSAAYRAANKEKVTEHQVAYNAKNKEKTAAYCAANKDRIKKQNAAYFAANKDKVSSRCMIYARNRRLTDPSFRLSGNLRARIRKALLAARTGKSQRSLVLLGCTPEFFKGYIEAKWEPEMTWENYGSYWEVDHIIPCATFDLTSEDEQRQCFNYSNHQPLEKKQNKAKGDKLPGPHQGILL